MADQATADTTYLLTDEQLSFREVVRQIAQERVAPRAAEIDEKAEYPHDLRKLLAEQDILGLPFDEEHGGTGTGALTLNIAIEELAKACASTALILMVQELGSLPIKLFGSEELKQRYLPRLASGEWTPAFALSEVEAGSDPGGMRTRAVRHGDGWVLNGEKNWITNLGIADLFVVFAVTDPDEGHSRGISAFVVERDWPGVSIGKLEHKMGIRGSPTGQPVFADVRVPAENLIGEESQGFTYAMQTLDYSRPTIAAQALGIAQGAFDFAVRYTTERQQFGKPISHFEGLQFMVADMEMEIEAARLLVYRAASMVDAKDPRMTLFASIAKCFAADAAMKVTTDAVQLLGGYGYMGEYPVERMMRDAKITQIYEGTNQIQRVVIARNVLKSIGG